MLKTERGVEFRESKVESAPFYTSKQIDHLILETEVNKIFTIINVRKYHLWEGKAIFILQRALSLEDLRPGPQNNPRHWQKWLCAFAVLPFAKFRYKLKFPHRSAPYQRKIAVPLHEPESLWQVCDGALRQRPGGTEVKAWFTTRQQYFRIQIFCQYFDLLFWETSVFLFCFS